MRPRIGIIHKPYYNQLYKQGRTYFGTPECGLFVKDKFPEKLRRLQRVTPLMPFPNEDTIANENYNLWLCASMNKNQDIMNQLIDACRPINIARVAGSGNKFVHMIDQKSDYYINLVPGFKYWDMCASEALIQAKMGIVTDANSRPLLYDHTKDILLTSSKPYSCTSQNKTYVYSLYIHTQRHEMSQCRLDRALASFAFALQAMA